MSHPGTHSAFSIDDYCNRCMWWWSLMDVGTWRNESILRHLVKPWNYCNLERTLLLTASLLATSLLYKSMHDPPKWPVVFPQATQLTQQMKDPRPHWKSHRPKYRYQLTDGTTVNLCKVQRCEGFIMKFFNVNDATNLSAHWEGYLPSSSLQLATCSELGTVEPMCTEAVFCFLAHGDLGHCTVTAWKLLGIDTMNQLNQEQFSTTANTNFTGCRVLRILRGFLCTAPRGT